MIAAMQIRPWPDTVIDKVGHDARSRYVEQFWLGILGPSTTWFLRLVAHRLDGEPEGFDLDLRAVARTLGVGSGGPLQRTIDRTVRFGLAREAGTDALEVRRRLPPLTRWQIDKLHESDQQAHQEWQQAVLTFDELQRRARRLALSLFETGDDPEAVEHELHKCRYHPALASAATTWAHDRHRAAARAAG
jgi:hypothetical protein